MQPTSNSKMGKLDLLFTSNEKHIIILALENLCAELEKFSDKKHEFGDITISVDDVRRLQEYLYYG